MPLGYPSKIVDSEDGVIKGYFVLTEQFFLKKKLTMLFLLLRSLRIFWGGSVMLVTSKLSNDGTYSQYVFGVP